MAKKAIKGKFPYKNTEKLSKKAKKKKFLEDLRKADKAKRMQAECNHIDSKKGETHFKKSDDGNYLICKICGGKIIADSKMITKESVEGAVEIVYSLLSKVRNEVNLDEKTDAAITTTNMTVMRLPEIYKEMAKSHSEKKNKKKNKKKDKKKNKGTRRINY